MAKSISADKRENEKKRLARRAEKQKKKEEKKLSNKASSFEDMIAYVDENGMITSTPPAENTPKEEIKLEVNPEKPDVPLNKNDAFQKVQKRRVQEKR